MRRTQEYIKMGLMETGGRVVNWSELAQTMIEMGSCGGSDG
jgi:hypothetical protein